MYGRCHFYDMNLNKTHPNFQPKSDTRNRYVFGVDFSGKNGSTIHTMTDDICNTFHFTKSIAASELKLFNIDENALYKCTKLESIFLYRNNITHLKKDVFKNNKKLKLLEISYNQFTSIDPSIFENLSSLEKLVLDGNSLREFPVKNMRQLNQLSSLHLAHNKLRDLDEQEIIKKFPKLKYLHFCPNNEIPKDRLASLVWFFTSKSIHVNYVNCFPKKIKFK